jgi:D-3-phosphoglycerate dehydrogenase
MSETFRVLIADDMSKKAVEILSAAGFEVDVKTGLPPAELTSILGNYHGLGVRSATKVTAAVLANPGKLKIIGRAGVGVDNIDVKAATEKGVLVINTPQGNAAAAAELAIGLMFALARKIPQAAETMRQGIWEKKKFMGVELAGKTLGVVGLGNIGRQAAERGVGLKMNVIGYDPFPPKQLPAGVKLASLDEVITKSDFITLHVPMTADTKGLFGAATFA